MPKYFSHMVASATKQSIVDHITPFQIGAVPGHRAQEHLSKKEKENEALAIQLFDLVKYFDSESLIDNLNEMYRAEVKGKLYRLTYEMNKDYRITVWTPVGDSEKKETGETLTQGSIDAGIISSLSLSNGINDFFDKSEHEISYVNLKLQPQTYQDDIMRLCDDPTSGSLVMGMNTFDNQGTLMTCLSW